jgi:hypothetical protein
MAYPVGPSKGRENELKPIIYGERQCNRSLREFGRQESGRGGRDEDEAMESTQQ